MPIYEYRCKKCGNSFEELVARDPGKPLPCPSCKSEETEKLMSAVGGISMGSSSAGAGCGAADSCAAAGTSCCSGGGCPMAQ
ncbi:MAG: FmdB family zinc ribbon protein [Chitinivibrionales bacterium]